MLEKLIYYNANTHNVHSGDCVKRAISLAFNLDYEYIAKLLRQKAKELRINSWQVPSVFIPVIEDLLPYGDLKEIYNNGTVAEFTAAHSVGTYIIQCGEEYPNHLLCVIDGNIYDSWDSSNLKCFNTYIIDNKASNIYSYDEQKNQLKDYANKVCSELISQYGFKYGFLSCTDDSEFFVSDFAFNFFIRYHLDEIGYKNYGDLCDSVEFTFSPRRSLEENQKVIFKLCKKVITKLAKVVQAYISEYESQEYYEDLFEYDRASIKYKLPLWSQKLLIKADRYFSYNYGSYIYDLVFQPLQGDPNQYELEIKELLVSEIKKDLEQYRKTFERPDIDY